MSNNSKKIKSISLKLALLISSLLVLEIGYRVLIYSPLNLPTALKDPGSYYNYFTDNGYWKLNYDFGERNGNLIRGNLDPILGWRGYNVLKDYSHRFKENINGRRPVLMYGDSFGDCVPDTCFEHYFNEDPIFSKKCYFLNYSVGSYGLDQITMLLKKSLPIYDNPLVIFAPMTLDLDRSLVSAFTSPKPHYKRFSSGYKYIVFEDWMNPQKYFESNYLLNVSLLFKFISNRLRSDVYHYVNVQKRSEIRQVNNHILDQAHKDLSKLGLENYLVFVFIPNWVGQSFIEQPIQDDWRFNIIGDYFKSKSANLFSSREVVLNMMKEGGGTSDDFFIPQDGHPNMYQNQKIYEFLKTKMPYCYSE